MVSPGYQLQRRLDLSFPTLQNHILAILVVPPGVVGLPAAEGAGIDLDVDRLAISEGDRVEHALPLE